MFGTMLRSRTILGLLLLAILPASGWAQSPKMKAHFINVGQAASALLEFPCGAVLIDAGAQDDDAVEHLAEYVHAFFQRRQDLNNTLACVYITHPHIDHTRGLRRLAQVCRIARFVDSGLLKGSGAYEVKWIRKEVQLGHMTTMIRPVNTDEVRNLPQRRGLSDDTIDPLDCTNVNPRIRILLASHPVKPPGWSNTEFGNENNQSLVIRVDFGETSLLFTGDLQEEGINYLLNYYQGTSILNTDVLHVGHHGSHNATTPALLAAVTPEAAVIGVGRWDYGYQNPNVADGYNTYRYGHPRLNVMYQLTNAIPLNRPVSRQTRVFRGAHDPVSFNVIRNIYATGWDGDIVLDANAAGQMFFTPSVGTSSGVGPLAAGAPSVRVGPPLPPPLAAADGYTPPAPYDSVAAEELEASSAPPSGAVTSYSYSCRHRRWGLFRRRR